MHATSTPLGLSVRAAIVLAITASSVALAQHPGAEPARVTVVGTDYAFVELPTMLRPGPTLFAFENRGSKRHEMSVLLLKPGIAVESLISGSDRPAASSRAVSDSIIGLLLARPGERGGGQLYATLIAGRQYLVICMLRDTPDAHPHVELGMVGSFRVSETPP